MPLPRKDRIFGPELPRIPKRAFPHTLSEIVFRRWNNMCSGEYVTPPCPPKRLLQAIVESVYLAGSSPEEARFPRFNVIATPDSNLFDEQYIGNKWPFTEPRELSVSELRRLAPAVDIEKSAIWVVWSEASLRIAGLVDFGTSWYRARMGLEYKYQGPSCLFIEADRPGRIRVYQGNFLVATLVDGTVTDYDEMCMNLSLHDSIEAALHKMSQELVRPKVEEPREYYGFEFLALWNTYIAIANTVANLRHGGTLVILPSSIKINARLAKIKYNQKSNVLRSAFIDFINSRHSVSDFFACEENGEKIQKEDLFYAQLKLRDSYSALVEATKFVAQLSGCDGAIILRGDLQVAGFGAELGASLKRGAQVVQVFDNYDEMNQKYFPIDLEQFGMRHRSAVKFVSQEPRARILVISQDGPISAVWSDGDAIIVRKGLNLVNRNMPWA